VDLRRLLTLDTVVEVQWEITPEGEVVVYHALITKVQVRIVRVRWLHEIEEEDDVFIIDPKRKEDSVDIKLIFDTCADVTELTDRSDAATPAGVPAGQRWWQRAVEQADEAAAADDAAGAAAGAASSSTSRLSARAARMAAATAAATAVEDADDEDLDSELAPPDPPLLEPALFGRARRVVGAADCAYPSNNPYQWLSDLHLANGHLADDRPEGSIPVRYNYPRASSMVPSIFQQRPALRVLQECKSILIQPFCDGLHWHNLALHGPERTAYYWEPMGSSLNRRGAIYAAFEAAALSGWKLESITLELQADGHSCGDWAHWFRCRVLAYAALDVEPMEAEGGSAVRGHSTFEAFLRNLPSGVTNLRSVRGPSKRAADIANNRFITARRDALRELLRGAVRKRLTLSGEARVEAFTQDGASAKGQVFIDLDEDLAGDSTFNPIML
jgi:hypothetical protein